MIQQFTTTDTEDNLRLGVFLAEKLDISRSQAQKLIKGGLVKVNDEKVTKPSLKVVDGDLVDVEEVLQVPSSKLQVPDLDVLYENADVLVVNKPSDLLVHRTMPEDTSPTLVHTLLKHDPGIAGVGDDPEERPGIVHRLDKNASGVLVVAKNQIAFEHLKQQFATRAAKKEYAALVYGKVEQDAGEINFRIGRSKRSGKMVAKPKDSEEGKEAITTFDVVQRNATTTLLKVQIKTGRTHQIRAHMLAYDHPVVGDPLYKKRVMNKIRPIELDRLFLHAAKLTIILPGGEIKTFEAPLPKELETLLNKLNGNDKL